MTSPADRGVQPATPSLLVRRDIVLAALPFVNFFLIITALYHIKPASRSIFLTALGSEYLAFAWIATAVMLGAVLSVYHWLIGRVDRSRVVLATALVFAAGLVVFRQLLSGDPAPLAAGAFLVFVDILAVIQVEQLWSQVNSMHDTTSGRRWYAYVGTGGLLGGVVGGAVAGALTRYTPLQSADLLLVAAPMVAATAGFAAVAGRTTATGVDAASAKPGAAGWRELITSRYLALVAAILLLAQLATPVVEYQFLRMVEENYADQEARTAFLSTFFSVLGVVAIGVNVVVTRAVHRHLGVIAGLLVQPLAMMVSAITFMAQPLLFTGMMLKISDRGLSYSINRASRELLYVPIDPVALFRAKAWIDMFGYRLSKAMGAGLVLWLTQWNGLSAPGAGLGWATLVICLVWACMLLMLRCEYCRAVSD